MAVVERWRHVKVEGPLDPAEQVQIRAEGLAMRMAVLRHGHGEASDVSWVAKLGERLEEAVDRYDTNSVQGVWAG
jgi:hypothetical protein